MPSPTTRTCLPLNHPASKRSSFKMFKDPISYTATACVRLSYPDIPVVKSAPPVELFQSSLAAETALPRCRGAGLPSVGRGCFLKHRNHVPTTSLFDSPRTVAITLEAHTGAPDQVVHNLMAVRHARHVGLYVRPCLQQAGLLPASPKIWRCEPI